MHFPGAGAEREPKPRFARADIIVLRTITEVIMGLYYAGIVKPGTGCAARYNARVYK